MTYQTKTQLQTYANSNLNTNGVEDITGLELNTYLTNLHDSINWGSEYLYSYWNPTTNQDHSGSALPAAGAAYEGRAYEISTTGTFNLNGAGAITLYQGDRVVCYYDRNTLSFKWLVEPRYNIRSALSGTGAMLRGGASGMEVFTPGPGTEGYALVLDGSLIPQWTALSIGEPLFEAFEDARLLEDSASNPTLDWENMTLLNGGATIMDWSLATLYDLAGLLSINIDTRVAQDPAGNSSIEWQSRLIKDHDALLAIDYGTRTLNNTSEIAVVDWESETLIDSTRTIVDWSRATFNSLTGDPSGDFDNRELTDSSGVVGVDWERRRMYDSLSNTLLDWEVGNLSDTSATPSIDWLGRSLFDSTAMLAVDWENRYLFDPAGNNVLDWSTNAGQLATPLLSIGGSMSAVSASRVLRVDGIMQWDGMTSGTPPPTTVNSPGANRVGSGSNWLGTPDAWIALELAGVNGVIPWYAL